MDQFDELRRTLHEKGSIIVGVKVSPRSPRTEFKEICAAGTLKVNLRAVPEKGKANAELCHFLARLFDVPKAGVTIVSGETAPRKLVKIGL